jgi:hypothetical protein
MATSAYYNHKIISNYAIIYPLHVHFVTSISSMTAKKIGKTCRWALQDGERSHKLIVYIFRNNFNILNFIELKIEVSASGHAGALSQRVNQVLRVPNLDGDARRIHGGLSWFGQKKALRPVERRKYCISLHLSACVGVTSCERGNWAQVLKEKWEYKGDCLRCWSVGCVPLLICAWLLACILLRVPL